MSKLKELEVGQRQARDALIAKMFLEEDAEVVLCREKRQLQGYDLTPVVVILASELRRLRQLFQER
ncbi:hypothetical protein GZ989_000890 [Campylobacter fetus]|uniref:hypothetical protein n=1 Tax=Campylobacter fetus TaxID=196 RepID=UPI000818AAB0|nr:hypothetical protein [Campylobacter fetus]OCS32238.1 hypothetical protein AWR31_09885 [Campylobacter fetus subsp. venerealis]KAA3683921.1 hypothetical protein E3U42_09970 [Campylobacter fetus subsp. fetus]OCS22727.1 hypothetical protein CFVI9825_09600 [Campylobacter fetus subsp. venerealis cfvi9825]QMS58587.1 hypothetical protein GZ989_010330 [Campylobacter fetus]QMS58714.1 hypothetical protein GZ989_000055 [Campylobacter fetus]